MLSTHVDEKSEPLGAGAGLIINLDDGQDQTGARKD